MLRFITIWLVLLTQITNAMNESEMKKAIALAEKNRGEIESHILKSKQSYEEKLNNGELVEMINKQYKAYKNMDTSNTNYRYSSLKNKKLDLIDTLELEKNASALDLENKKVKNTDHLFIFVSFSMPDAVLKQYIEQGKIIGASIVMRGFIDNNYVKTKEKIDKMDLQSGFLIDPVSFQKFGINKVPTFVLTTEAEEVCLDKVNCKLPDHIRGVGISSIEDFLNEASIDNDKKTARVAKKWLEKLR